MADCRYCRKPAGFLRSKHPDCEAQYESAKSQISDTIWQALSSANLLESLQTRIADLAQRCYISNSVQKRLVGQAWTRAVDQFLEDGVLDDSEEKRLMELKERFALSQTELDAKGALTRVAKAAVIRDVLNGSFLSESSLTVVYRLISRKVKSWSGRFLAVITSKIKRDVST